MDCWSFLSAKGQTSLKEVTVIEVSRIFNSKQTRDLEVINIVRVSD